MNRKQRRAQEKGGTKGGGSPAGIPGAMPDQAAVLNSQAVAIFKTGQTAEAIALLRQAVMLAPKNPMYSSNLGELLRLSGKLDEAAAELDRAVTLTPPYADAHSNRGNLLRDLGRVTEARDAYLTALRIRPNFPEALSNLATSQLDLGDHAGAVDASRKAIALNPQQAILYKNLILALFAMGDYDGAETAFAAMEKAPVKLPHENIDLLIARGDMARARSDLEAALRYYEQAQKLQPGHSLAHMRYGTALMVKGDYRAAWPHFEARWGLAEMMADRRPFALPQWNGRPLSGGGKLLLVTEQGVGETLVLLSVLPQFLAYGYAPVVECDPRMIPLLERSFPGLEVYSRSNPPHPRLLQSDLQAQISLFDLAAAFRASPADCTGVLPLKADMARAASLRAQYQADDPRPLVGIAWHSGNLNLGKPKSAKPVDFAPLLTLPGYRFVDLQYGNRVDDRAALKAQYGVDLLYDPAIDQLKDLEGFAAQVAALDMVISTSNTTAHMAAALGKPTWLMLHKGISPHWYWTHEGSTTPWYPTARLWRQPNPGDWTGLAEIIAAELPKVL